MPQGRGIRKDHAFAAMKYSIQDNVEERDAKTICQITLVLHRSEKKRLSLMIKIQSMQRATFVHFVRACNKPFSRKAVLYVGAALNMEEC